MTAAVRAGAYLHHIQLLSTDPGRLAAFYADAMDMLTRPLDNSGGHICEGPGRRVLFAQGPDRALGWGAFACRDRDALAEVRARAEAAGAAILPSPSPLLWDAFGVRDPDGNLVLFGLVEQETAQPPVSGLRGPIQHLTLATHDPDAIEEFYANALGFLPSDRVRGPEGSVRTCFLRSNHEHHSLACFRSGRQGIDHHSYEAGDWSVIKDWCDRMGARRIPIMWGPGRHGPGNNLFVFVEDPDGNWIEISAELEVVHDRPVKEWPHEERTLNLWGRAILRTPVVAERGEADREETIDAAG